MRQESTCQDIGMSQLSSNTSHMNNWYGAQNIGVIMGMSDVNYSGFYGSKLFVTSHACAQKFDNNMAVELSVAHTVLNYSAEQHNDQTNNCSTCK